MIGSAASARDEWPQARKAALLVTRNRRREKFLGRNIWGVSQIFGKRGGFSSCAPHRFSFSPPCLLPPFSWLSRPPLIRANCRAFPQSNRRRRRRHSKCVPAFTSS